MGSLRSGPVGLLVLGLSIGLPAGALSDECRSVLLFDLDGDGLFLSDASYPVHFDLDGDGVHEATTWTASGQEEAFLWHDLDEDGEFDGSAELVCGSATPEDSSFDRLRRLDRQDAGGNGDGWINAEDAAFAHLRLWVDRDHDGQMDRREHGPPSRWEVTGINLGSVAEPQVDGNLNLHTAVSTYRKNEVGVGPLIEVRLRRLD